MKRGLAALALAAAALASACGPSYVGGARPIDPAAVRAEAGWVVAGPTPTLKQKHDDDCGPAVLAMVAARWQVPLTVAEAVALLPPPGPLGSRLRHLRDAARARGLVAFAIAGDRPTLLHELRAGRPVIVGLLLPFSRGKALSHYEVVVAATATADRFVTIDPARAAWRQRTWEALEAEWKPVGRPTLVVLGPAPAGAMSAARSRP